MKDSHRPSFFSALILTAAMVAVMAWLRFDVFSYTMVPEMYALPLVLTLWHRDRRLLIGSAAAFAVITFVRVHRVSPILPPSGDVRLAFWGMHLLNIVVVALIVDAAVRLQEGREAKSAALRNANRELTTLNDQLTRRTIQLRALATELTQAEERERRRLAQVLHDYLQQLLVAAKLGVSALGGRTPDEAHQAELKRLRDILDQAIAASRSLTAELAPPVLYESSLPEALRWLARWTEETHHLAVEVSADERPAEIVKDLRIFLFQAVREFLLNAVKHAKVDRAKVTLCYGDAETVSIRVEDEGVGFDPDAHQPVRTTGGFGLFSVRERLAALGGDWEIRSAPGAGTRVTIRLPVRFEATMPTMASAAAPFVGGPKGR